MSLEEVLVRLNIRELQILERQLRGRAGTLPTLTCDRNNQRHQNRQQRAWQIVE